MTRVTHRRKNAFGLDVDLHGFVGFFHNLNLATWLERVVLTFSLVINFQQAEHVFSSTKALTDDSNLPRSMQKHLYRFTPSIRCQNDHLFWLEV